jgi:hypothetical protein
MPMGRALVALLLAAALSPAADTPPQLRTLQGTTITGYPSRITPREIVQRQGEKEVSTPVDEVLAIDFGNKADSLRTHKYTDVALADGSLLHCNQVTLRGKEAELELIAGQKLKAPLDAVAYILNDAQDAKAQQDWKELLAKKHTSDVLTALKEGELVALNGTLGEADAEGKEIQFDLNSQGSPRAVKLEKVHGLIFYRQPDPKAPPVVCKVYDTFGDVIAASAVTVTAGGYTVKTPAGVEIDCPSPQLVRLDYSRGKLVYLSDLQPVDAGPQDKSRFVTEYRDRNPDGQPGLRLGKVTYAKGLTLFAPAKLEYELDGDFREFSAWLGVDEKRDDGLPAPARVVIEGDGKQLYARTVGATDEPQRVTCPVKGVRRLRILVTPPEGENIPNNRYVDLADAKVSK